jgi:hypothetical protein
VDQAYRVQRSVIRQPAPKTQDFINRRYRHRGVVHEVGRAKKHTKSKVRRGSRHAVGVIMRVVGFAKACYRGLKKNTHRLLVTFQTFLRLPTLGTQKSSECEAVHTSRRGPALT